MSDRNNLKYEHRVPTARLLAYCVPDLAIKFLIFPLLAIIPTFYGKYTQVDAFQISGILFSIRLFDAFTDPLIGHLSDRTRSPIGRRKPWMIGGTALIIVSVYFLFMPTPTAGAGYFLVWSFLTYLGWTMVDIPHKAWGTEITREFHERSRLVTYRSTLGNAGFVIFLCAPFLPMFSSTEMGPDVLALVAWAIIIGFPVLTAVAVRWGPDKTPIAIRESTLKGIVDAIRRNRPLWIYLAVFLFVGVGKGIETTLFFAFVDLYLGIGSKFSYLALTAAIAGLLALPVWLKIVRRFGKHQSWGVSYLLQAVISPVVLFIEPGTGAFIPLLILSIITAAISAAYWVVPGSILGDIIDYDILKTGRDQAGKYLSLSLLMYKGTIAIGTGLSFFLLGMFGFDFKTADQTDLAQTGMLITYVGIPVVCYVIAFFIIRKFPLDARRHDIIRRRIEQRAARHALNTR